MFGKPKYEPGTDPEKVPDSLVPGTLHYGMTSRGFVHYEEDAQRTVAELPIWQLARRHMGSGDSRRVLESLGFKVSDEGSDLFYSVIPPNGWTKTTEGYWTTVFDADGKERITQFFKGAIYDRDAFLNINQHE